MASAFTVLTADLRRANVKVPAGSYMIDVLDEACAKLKLNSEAYQLKHNNKSINLTDPVRAAGLTQNAKLELVVKSKSPSVVTVAVRLPPSEARLGLPNNRVAAKVRSDTPLWKLLRHLEDSARPVPLNITARGVPRTSASTSAGSVPGSGQLYWEMPVLRFAGRELASLADFGKTLGQVGIDTGSQLIHLEFRLSDLPLQDAMEQVHRTLEKVTTEAAADKAAADKATKAAAAETTPTEPRREEQKEKTPAAPAQDGPSAVPQTAAAAHTQPQPSPPASTTEPMDVDEKPRSRPEPQQEAAPSSPAKDNAYLEPVQVWRPPKAGTGMPAAAAQAWRTNSSSSSGGRGGGGGGGGGDEDDPTTFMPSVAQLQAHQKHLEEAGRNKRLKSEAELAEDARVQAAKAAAVRKVDVRIRFPDGHTVLWSLPNGATGATLHAAVRGVLTAPALQQGFRLALPMARGPGDVIQDRADAPQHDLVRGYGMRGGVLLNYLRGGDAAAAPPPPPRQGYLRPEVAAQAEDIVVPQPAAASDDEAGTGRAGGAAEAGAGQASSAGADNNKRAANKAEALNKMSKFLRLAKK